MNHTSPLSSLFLVLVLALASFSSVWSQDHTANLKDYLTNDVIAVVYFDIEKISPQDVITFVEGLKILNEDELVAYSAVATAIQLERVHWQRAGIQTIYALLRVSDFGHATTSWVVIVDNQSPQNAIEVIKATLERYPSPMASTWQLFASRNQSVLIAGNDVQLKRLEMHRPSKDRDFTEAWNAIGAGSMGGLLIPDKDMRRVFREIPYQFPTPAENLDTAMLAEHLVWAGFQVEMAPRPNLRFEFELNDEKARKEILEVFEFGMNSIIAKLTSEIELSHEQQESIRSILKPKVVDHRLQITIGITEQEQDFLQNQVSKMLTKYRGAYNDQKDLNNLRQLALAMHNYYSCYTYFPIYNRLSESKPAGLSWRVALLPFLDQNELYQQFNLDEPWDSDHNIKLVERMPVIYRSPLPENLRANQEGRTVYQVPLHPESIFAPDNDKGIKFNNIEDGSSNTILIVTVAAENAVPWTQPADWEVDMADPLKGLIDDKRQRIYMARADGSVQTTTTTIKPETLRALITRSGKDLATTSE